MVTKLKRFISIFDETERLKVDAAARWLARHAEKVPPPELTESQWQQAQEQRFLRTRWYREGKTFDWWLKRRRKLRRITKQQQRRAARRR
jgi:hypothetical protein